MADLVAPSTISVWDPLGGTPEPPMTGHDGILYHTMAGSFAGTDSWFHQNGWSGTESTWGVAGSGYCKQWVPWNRQADANLEMNARYLSVELADAGESFPPLSTANDESPPMTAAQIERCVKIGVYVCDVRNHRNCPATWACHARGIPPVWMGDSCDAGIGVHRHGIDPWRLRWSGGRDCPEASKSDGKICPRSVRLRQVRDQVVPEIARRLNAPQEEDWFDMATKADLDAVIKANLDDIAAAVWARLIDIGDPTDTADRHRAWVVLRDARNLAARAAAGESPAPPS